MTRQRALLGKYAAALLALVLPVLGSACTSGTGDQGARSPAATADKGLATSTGPARSVANPEPPRTGFGVIVPGGHGNSSAIVNDLGATWVRIDVNLGHTQPDPRWYLDKGINVILTVSQRDGSNADQTYGAPEQWPDAGFPYLSADRYEGELRQLLTPLVPSVAAGRQVWVQCENEVADASVIPQSHYWRGTTAQYLALEQTCHDTTTSVDPSMRVVLSSFSSAGLDEADSNGPGSKQHQTFYEKLLRDGSYDAVDLHFYGCVADIPARVRWVDRYRRPGARWISTEDGGPDPRCPSTPQSWDQDHAAFEQAQAAQVPQRLRACADSGGAVCLWFSLFDLATGGPVFPHLGLLDGSTTPPRRKPAYAAFQSFTRRR